MLITYEKYNFETELDGIAQVMGAENSIADLDHQTDMFSVSNAPPFDEIAIMKELVLEFGEAINERIKEGSDGPAVEVTPVHGDVDEPANLDSLHGAQLRR